MKSMGDFAVVFNIIVVACIGTISAKLVYR